MQQGEQTYLILLAIPNDLFIYLSCRGQQKIDDGWYDDQSYYEVEYYYDDSEDDADVDYSRKPVPILLSIILVVAYIIGGAFLFQMWEGWSFLDSSYFCFITLTTIGKTFTLIALATDVGET